MPHSPELCARKQVLRPENGETHVCAWVAIRSKGNRSYRAQKQRT